jgi:uncharacterized protein YajQ (UPF0234 family)
MPSFDVVSEADKQEVTNAYDQTVRELRTRYDFRNTGAEAERNDTGFVLRANSEDRVIAAAEVLKEKLIKRGVSLRFFTWDDPQPAGGMTYRQDIPMSEGIASDEAKKIIAALKQSKLKVQAQVQGDSLRVTGKKRDFLQEAIALMKGLENVECPLAFTNFRD